MTSRNRRLRARRARGMSTHQLANEFGISQTQVLRILEATGGDPRKPADLADRTPAELEAERDRLRMRIATDRRRLRAVLDELEVRHIDALIGLA